MKMGARSWSTTTAAASSSTSSSSSSSSGGSSSSVDSYSSSGPLCPPSSSSSSSSSPSCLAVAVAAICSHHHRRSPPPPPPSKHHQKAGNVLDSVTSKDLAVAVQKAERSRAVRRDLILDLPTRVSLPDGEELPYGSSRHFRIRDNEQESEIRREYIRPPPNRIAPHPDVSQPPFRCYSEGILMKGHPTASSSSSKNKSSPSSILAVGSSNLFLDHHYNDEGELSRLLLDMDGQPIVTRSKSMSTGSYPASSSRLEATVKSCVRSIKERLTGVEQTVSHTPDAIRRRPSAPERTTAAGTSSSSSLVLASLPVLTCDSDEGSSSSICLSSGK